MTTPYTEPVLAWFARHARDLPWRGPGATPWSVLVSEIMLQQTPVARVVPAHQSWLARWPTPAALAAEPAGEAIRQWGRLGYPRRALRLHETATIVTARHGGTVPDDIDALLALPGIGSYTAAAVASFAYGQRHAVLDTNVRRVLARLVDGQPRPRSTPSPAERRMAESLLPAEPAVAARWSVAVMELGALVCTAASPRCAELPGGPALRLAGRRPPTRRRGASPAPGAAVRRHGPAVPGAPARGAARRRRARHRGPSSTRSGPTGPSWPGPWTGWSPTAWSIPSRTAATRCPGPSSQRRRRCDVRVFRVDGPLYRLLPGPCAHRPGCRPGRRGTA